MEDAMPNIRIAIGGVAFLLLTGIAASGAAAQTAPDETAGKPLQLLRVAAHPAKAKTKSHARLLAHSIARKSRSHRSVAARTPPNVPAQAATAPTPDSVWPAANPLAPTDVAAIVPAAQPALAAENPGPSELVVAGQTVQVAAPDHVNEIDLAASDGAAQAGTTAPSGATANAQAMANLDEASSKSDSLTTASAQPRTSLVGSASWIAQVLAALGGAVAAGTVAWFLIGSTPQRTYG
jgi:hypothetical protein